MKQLMVILLILPLMASAQTKKDYERTVGNFMKFYNNHEVDSIIGQYDEDTWGEQRKSLWSQKIDEDIKNKYGKMVSYKYIELYKSPDGDGGGDGLAFFKVVFTKSTHMMAISLGKNNKLETFRFKTTSPHIDSLLRKN